MILIKFLLLIIISQCFPLGLIITLTFRGNLNLIRFSAEQDVTATLAGCDGSAVGCDYIGCLLKLLTN